MTVQRARNFSTDHMGRQLPAGEPGYPVLELLIDGHVALIGSEQKFIRYGFDLAFLGSDWEERLPAIKFPGDPSQDLQATELQGFTDDPHVVKLVRDFITSVDDDTFTTGMPAMSA